MMMLTVMMYLTVLNNLVTRCWMEATSMPSLEGDPPNSCSWFVFDYHLSANQLYHHRCNYAPQNSRNPSHKALWSSSVGIDTTSIGLETIAQGGTMVIEVRMVTLMVKVIMTMKAIENQLKFQDCP